MLSRRETLAMGCGGSILVLSGCITTSTDRIGTVHSSGHGQHERQEPREFAIVRENRLLLSDRYTVEPLTDQGEEFHEGGVRVAYAKKRSFEQLSPENTRIFERYNRFAEAILGIDARWERLDEAITNFFDSQLRTSGLIQSIMGYLYEIADYTGEAIATLRDRSNRFDWVVDRLTKIINILPKLPEAAAAHLNKRNAFGYPALETEDILQDILAGEPVDYSKGFNYSRPRGSDIPLYDHVSTIASASSTIRRQIEGIPASFGIPPELAPVKWDLFIEIISGFVSRINAFADDYRELIRTCQQMHREANDLREQMK